MTPRIIGLVNWIGLQTLVQKEVGRFLNVYMQTVIAPLVTLLLFFTVFSIALGGGSSGTGAREILGVPYMYFLAPGLLMMTMAQNAFANSSSSLIIAKVQGNIVDILMPPLSSTEILLGLIIGATLRGMMIGLLGAIILAVFIHVPFTILE
jgi:ABC-2 type transport system permease protein